MDIYVRGLNNDMIKPYDNCGLESVVNCVTQKVLIQYTTIRLFIPPQVHKMTPNLRQIFGCDICIITKDMHIDLNIPHAIFVTDLQHKSVGTHTSNLFI